jgi:hypothetical protein
MARSEMGVVICPELFLRSVHVPAARNASNELDLFPLTDPSTTSRLVVGYRRDRYSPVYCPPG